MQGNTHCVEVSRADHAALGKHLLIGGIGRLTGNVEVAVNAPALDRQMVDEARGPNARQMAHTLFERPVESCDHVAAFILGTREAQLDGKNMTGIEAEVSVAIARDNAQEQAGYDEKNKREGDLGYHKTGAQASLTALRARAAAGFQCPIGIDMAESRSAGNSEAVRLTTIAAETAAESTSQFM